LLSLQSFRCDVSSSIADFTTRSDKHITDQMTVLNSGYEGTGISFKLVNTTRILSKTWFEELNVPEGAAMYVLCSLFLGFCGFRDYG